MSKRSSNKKIIIFLCLTFLLMYLSHGIIGFLLNSSIVQEDSFIIPILGIIGGGAPAFAALIMLSKMYSEEERKNFWRRVYLYKISIKWWIISILSPLLIGILANLIYKGGLWNPEIEIGAIIGFPIAFLFMIFAGGAEELGWRGILQEEMLEKYNLAFIGIIIGFLWGIWHLPLFLIDKFAHYDYSIIVYILSTIVFSLILTLIYYKTRSTLLTILMHASINAFGNLGFGIPMEENIPLIIFLVGLIIILSIILNLGKNKFKIQVLL